MIMSFVAVHQWWGSSVSSLCSCATQFCRCVNLMDQPWCFVGESLWRGVKKLHDRHARCQFFINRFTIEQGVNICQRMTQQCIWRVSLSQSESIVHLCRCLCLLSRKSLCGGSDALCGSMLALTKNFWHRKSWRIKDSCPGHASSAMRGLCVWEDSPATKLATPLTRHIHEANHWVSFDVTGQSVPIADARHVTDFCGPMSHWAWAPTAMQSEHKMTAQQFTNNNNLCLGHEFERSRCKSNSIDVRFERRGRYQILGQLLLMQKCLHW